MPSSALKFCRTTHDKAHPFLRAPVVAGCQQTVVSEYTHTSLSEGQQASLVEAFGSLDKRQHNGVSVGSVLLVNEERVAGMARSDFILVWVCFASA